MIPHSSPSLKLGENWNVCESLFRIFLKIVLIDCCLVTNEKHKWTLILQLLLLKWSPYHRNEGSMYVQIAVNKNKLKSDNYLQSSQLTQNYIVLMSTPEIGSGGLWWKWAGIGWYLYSGGHRVQKKQKHRSCDLHVTWFLFTRQPRSININQFPLIFTKVPRPNLGCGHQSYIVWVNCVLCKYL